MSSVLFASTLGLEQRPGLREDVLLPLPDLGGMNPVVLTNRVDRLDPTDRLQTPPALKAAVSRVRFTLLNRPLAVRCRA